MKIFISYTTRDKNITQELLLKVYDELLEFETVYIDLIHNDSIDKQKRVFNELEASDQIVLIETKNVYNSNWVILELNRARFLKKEIIKITFDDLIKFLNGKKSQRLTTYIKNSSICV